MTLAEYIRWLIATRHRDYDWLKGSAIPSNIALRKLIKDVELPALETVARHLAAPETMPPVAVIWFKWILASLPTYQNHPRLNEHENNAVRRAALDEREARLAALNSTRVVHCQQQPYDVYIGRANFRARLSASKWGNPFQIGRDGDRGEVIAKYRAWVVQQPELMAALPELRGKVLGCWCKGTGALGEDVACHGDILAELANREISS